MSIDRQHDLIYKTKILHIKDKTSLEINAKGEPFYYAKRFNIEAYEIIERDIELEYCI